MSKRAKSYKTRDQKKKTIFISLLIVITIVFISACSEKENGLKPPPNGGFRPLLSTTPDLVIPIPSFNDPDFPRDYIEMIQYRGEEERREAVSFFHFIDKALTDDFSDNVTHETRALFTYNIVSGRDQRSPRFSSLPDLTWDVFKDGYLVRYPAPVVRGRSFFEQFDVTGFRGYFIHEVGTIELFRTIIVEKSVGDPVIFHTNLMNIVKRTINDVEREVILLSEFITKYITDSPEDFTYVITAVNNNPSDPFTWEQMQIGALVLCISRIENTDPENPDVSLTGRHRLWNPMTISLVRN